MSLDLSNENDSAYTWGEIADRQAERLVESGRHVDLLQITCDESESEDLAPAYVIVSKENGVRHGDPIIIPAGKSDDNIGEAYMKAIRNFKITEAYLSLVCHDETDTSSAPTS